MGGSSAPPTFAGAEEKAKLPPSFGSPSDAAPTDKKPAPPSFAGPGTEGGGFSGAELAAKAKAAARAALGDGNGKDFGMGMPPPKPLVAAAPPPAPSAVAEAAAAAARAAQHATPGQKERAMAEAALGVIAARQKPAPVEAPNAEADDKAKSAKEPPAKPKEAPGPYTPPEWDGPPGQPYSMEVLKEGKIVGIKDLQDKGHYTFGRGQCDVVLEHPSASRLHAVLQFNSETGEAFVMDCGSTHGTFVNKRKVKAKVYVPLTVGSMIKFGSSSRMYLLGGPVELMPEEGLNREERRKVRALEAAAADRVRQEQIAKAQMEQARGGSASWGINEDADMSEDEEERDVDWRVYKGGFNEKQEKSIEKIRVKERKIQNLKTETDAIHAKEGAQGGLTPGQAATAARNEQRISQLTEEMDDMEESLNDTIREAMGAKRRKERGDGAKKKKRVDEDEDGVASDDDDFYDRAGAKKRAKKAAKSEGGQEVETVASLWGRKEALVAERAELQKKLLEEEMTATAGGAGGGEEVDELDAFMSGVAAQVEGDRAAVIRKDLEGIDEQIARIDRLVKVADPDGFYRPKEEAVKLERRKAARQIAEEKAKKAAEERKRKEEAAAAAAMQAEMEAEAEEVAGGGGAKAEAAETAAGAAGEVFQDGFKMGLQVMKKVVKGPAMPPPAVGGAGAKKGPTMPPPPAAAAVARKKGPTMPPPADAPEAPAGPDEDGFLSREALKALGGVAGRKAAPAAMGAQAVAAARVAEDIAMLSRSRDGLSKAAADVGASEEDVAAWAPPTGQTGDGKTALNAKFGY